MSRSAISMFLAKVVCLAATCLTATASATTPTGSVCPPQPDPPDRQLLVRAQQEAADRGFLWRISRGGRDSFLYGTIHAGRAEWFALGPRVETALFRTGVLALEVNLTDPSALQALQQVMKRPPRPLTASVMRSLRQAWAGECLNASDLEAGPAELHVTQLAVARAQREGLFPLYGAESVLLMRSLAAQRPVVGLERMETQLEALLARDPDEAEAMVQASLLELGSAGSAQVLRRLVAAWNSSDLADLERYSSWCDCMNTEVERASHVRLIDGRNPGLAEAIEELHRDISVFAAVGALHMVGPQGLPALLRQRGFEVTRVF